MHLLLKKKGEEEDAYGNGYAASHNLVGKHIVIKRDSFKSYRNALTKKDHRRCAFLENSRLLLSNFMSHKHRHS